MVGCQDKTLMFRHAFLHSYMLSIFLDLQILHMHYFFPPCLAYFSLFSLFSMLLFPFLTPAFVSAAPYLTLAHIHSLHHYVFTGHLTLGAISNWRGGILRLITLTQGSVCTAACRGSWLEAGTGFNQCGKMSEIVRRRVKKKKEK